MARPTREAEALRDVASLAEDLADEAAGLVTWAESEMSTAGARFDKPAQARIAGLAISSDDAYAPGPQGNDEPGCFPKAMILIVLAVLVSTACLVRR